MKIALCQVNPTVGDFAGNATRIVSAARKAAAGGADLAIFPELVVCGYPPQDLLHKESFRVEQDAALQAIQRDLPEGLAALVGCFARNPGAVHGGKPLFNAAALLRPGRPLEIVCRKSLLPTYDVFDEARYFQPGAEGGGAFLWKGKRVGVTICEDIWNDKSFWPTRLYPDDPVENLIKSGVDVIVNLSASPWNREKEDLRFAMLRACATRHARPVLYVNQVGGNDGLIFDGGSLAVSAEGGLLAPLVQWEESVQVVDPFAAASGALSPGDPWAQVERALVLGIRDYFRKMGFRGAVLGMSGGIDSSVAATLVTRALGPDNVVGLSMPSQYSSEGSKTDADRLAANLGIRIHRVPIGPVFDEYRRTLAPVNGGLPEDVTEENLQARIRGALLMAYSNKHGHMVIATGNKTECAVGFCTIYGDTCGGLAILADLWKTEVYALARHFNREREVIPRAVLEKKASPELKPGQVTEDHLPPFDVLDPLLAALVEDELAPAAAAARTGAPLELARTVQRMLYRAEYKRFQFAPTLRVSKKAWVGRKYPIVHRFPE